MLEESTFEMYLAYILKCKFQMRQMYFHIFLSDVWNNWKIMTTDERNAEYETGYDTGKIEVHKECWAWTQVMQTPENK